MDREADMTKPIVAFHNFANVPKNDTHTTSAKETNTTSMELAKIRVFGVITTHINLRKLSLNA
jgi:hypothetical protein